MSVITIRGQMGSGAPEIGKLIADKLHIDYVDREIIAQVAARIHWSKEGIAEKETPPGTLLGRIAEALGHSYSAGAGYPGAYLPTWEIPLDDDSYLVGLQSVIRELADTEATVIRGRGSQFILKDRPDTFHILVVAPLAARVKRVASTMKRDEEAARKEILRSDSSHQEFIKRYFKAELEDPTNYDIVINTRALSFEAAASLAVTALSLKTQTAINPAGND
jgi:cytidylate kinase